MITLNGQIVTPTMFPDGTSQVWKLPEESFSGNPNQVLWQFEHEAEFIHLAQLLTLLDRKSVYGIILRIPYFPYGRQDKGIDNDKTFALRTFLRLLEGIYAGLWGANLIETFDLHSSLSLNHNSRLSKLLKVISPNELLNSIADQYDVVVYPDKGAAERYHIEGKPVVTATKVRDQETGRITHYFINEEDKSKLFPECKCLVVDDICDGGATFELLSQSLSEHIGLRPDLYVSHGIFSKGLDTLRPLYRKIITTDSLPTKHKELTVYESAPPHRLLQG